jgi:hypothetical protein
MWTDWSIDHSLKLRPNQSLLYKHRATLRLTKDHAAIFWSEGEGKRFCSRSLQPNLRGGKFWGCVFHASTLICLISKLVQCINLLLSLFQKDVCSTTHMFHLFHFRETTERVPFLLSNTITSTVCSLSTRLLLRYLSQNAGFNPDGEVYFTSGKEYNWACSPEPSTVWRPTSNYF